MLFVSLVFDNSRAFLSTVLAVWIALVTSYHPILSSIFVIAFIDTVQSWLYHKEKKSSITLLPLPLIIVCSTLLFAVIAVIFGAALLSDTENTLLFGLLLSALTVYPLTLTSGGSCSKLVDALAEFRAESPLQQEQLAAAAGAVAGSWCGALVIPLDWDRPWQEWPVSCCVGAHLGSAVGRLLARHICPRADNFKSE